MKKKTFLENYSLVVTSLSLISFMLLVGHSLASAEKVRGVSNDTVKIGYILDMTGPATVVTVPISKAFRDYFAR